MPRDEDLHYAVSMLRYATRGLSLWGQLAVASTVCHIGLVAAVALFPLRSDFSIAASISLFTFTVVVVLLFERRRKVGEALYEEISDEFQWLHARSQSLADDGPEEGQRPSLMARTELRTFARSSDLPLVPGRSGPLGYVVLNLALVVTVILLIRTVKGY